MCFAQLGYVATATVFNNILIYPLKPLKLLCKSVFRLISLTTSTFVFYTWEPLRPIYTIRFVVYDSDPGVCDRINTRTNVRFQMSPSSNEQKMLHQHFLSYVRRTIVYHKSYRVDRPLGVVLLKILVVKLSSLKLYILAYLRKIFIMGSCCYISNKNVIYDE